MISPGNQDLDQGDQTLGETWTQTTSMQVRVRVNNFRLLNNTTNPLRRNTTPTTPLLSSSITHIKPLHPSSIKVDMTRIRIKVMASRTSVAPLLNNTVDPNTITGDKDSISRVRLRGSGTIKVDISNNNIIISLLRITVVGDLLVGTGVKYDLTIR